MSGYNVKDIFHLVDTKDEHILTIFSDADYNENLGRIIHSGDLLVVVELLQKLTQTCEVSIPILADKAVPFHTEGNFEPPVSPEMTRNTDSSQLLQLTRTVVVTSSGKSKYDISDSEKDPYTDVELSDDEFKPETETSDSDSTSSHLSVDRAKVRRNLFQETKSKSPSPSCEATSPAPLLQSKTDTEQTHFQNVQPEPSSVIAVQPKPSSVIACSEVQNVQPKPSGSSCIDKILATVTIFHCQVEIHTIEPIHAGTYEVSLFKAVRLDNETFLQGYVKRKILETHHNCKSLDKCESVAVADTFRDGLRLRFSLDICCCPNTTLTGMEKFFERQGGHVAVLSCVQLAEIELEKTPVRKTKLKQHFCCYCQKLVTCIGRHLQRMHGDEDDVKKLKNLHGREKLKLLREMRLAADKLYNSTVGPHMRISVRRPVIQATKDSLHCPTCNALIARNNLSRHHLRCSKRHPDNMKRLRLIAYDQAPSNETLDQYILKKLLACLHDDEVSDVIRADKIIQDVGIFMSKSNRSMHQSKNSRTVMRRCARLLLLLKQMDPEIQSMKDCFVPSKYGLVIHAIRLLCSESHTEIAGKLKFPSVALHFGPAISTMVNRARRYYLEQGLDNSSPQMQALLNFETLHKSEFAVEITRDALNLSHTKKFHSRKELPKPADIQKLREYCNTVYDKAYSSLMQNGFDFYNWKLLGQVLLCQIMVFNRRRPGEISRTLLSDYGNQKKVGPEEYASLTRLEIICADLFTMIHIKGKRGRMLSILLQPDNIRGLDLYISMRKEADIPEDNQYLFCFNNKDGYLSASLALKTFTEKCGAENPKLLTGTFLRKQAATMCQLFNLNENELKQMADFMGHSFNVHLSHYRMPEQTTQIINISRFLSVVGDEDVFKYRGKTWEELQPFIPDDDDDVGTIEEDDNIEMDTEEEGTVAMDTAEEHHIGEDNGAEHHTEKHNGDVNLPSSSNKNDDNEASTSHPPEETTPTKVPGRRQRRRRQMTPSKGKPHSPGGPTTYELLHILSSPKNRTKIGSRKVKTTWTQAEISFIKQNFPQFFDKRAPRPKIVTLNRIIKENPNVFQPDRTGVTMYAWIQYQRRKL